MPNWIAITKDTLYEDRLAALIDACDSAALAEGQPPRSPAIIQAVVDEVRRKIASCAANRVDADPATLPKGLRNLAVDLILARLKKAIQQDLTEDERRDLARHETNLNRIAEGRDVIDQPDSPVPAETETPVAAPRFGTRVLTDRETA